VDVSGDEGRRKEKEGGRRAEQDESSLVANGRSGSASRLAWPGSKNGSLRSAGLHASAALVGS
jgi:hypothetical protein